MKNEISTMNPWIFWLALLGAGGISLALTMGDPKDVVEGVLITGLFWLGTFTLAWMRWVGTGGHWIARAAAGLIAAVIFWTAYRDLGRTDVFMCGCKGAASTFWPLVFLWLGALGAVAYIVSLSFKSFLALFKTVSFRSVAWWLFIAAWTGVCIKIFAENINAEVWRESLRSAGLFMLVPLGIIAAIAAVVYILSYPSRRRNKAMKAEFEKFDNTLKQEIVRLVDSIARKGEYLLCYQCTDTAEKNPDDAEIARIGGDPLTLPDEQWPMQNDGSPALFLLQVPLRASSLPAIWQERIISVFMQDWGLLVRSYAVGDLKQLAPKANPLGEKKVERSRLSVIALPYVKPSKPEDDEDDEYPGIDTEQLLEGHPELRARLAPLTKQPAKALAWILSDGKSSSVDCLNELGIQVGGNPYYIQNEHDAHCEICGKPMRFLFQFDDAFGSEYLLGDAGLGYVYGCDDHPEHCQGFVDCY